MKSTTVGVFYHFFPHYRKGVIEALGQSECMDLTFVGDNKGAEGIKEYPFDTSLKFKPVKTYYFGKFVIQPMVLWYALLGVFDVYVFLANPYFITTWLAALICRTRGRRVVFWGHGFKFSSLNLSNRIRRIFFRLADAFYTYGWRAKDNALALGFSSRNIYVGFNSLDYKSQLMIRNQVLAEIEGGAADFSSDRDTATLNILCISRLTELCRYDQLLRAMSVAKEKYSLDTRVVFVGDGPARGKLEALLVDLGLNGRFVGALYDEREIARHVFAADITVSPGKIGLTAMHSLMYGTPVVSNDDFVMQMPEVEAVIDGVTGYLFKANDELDLASKLFESQSSFLNKKVVREQCFRMIDEIYNPMKQVEVMVRAVKDVGAEDGYDAKRLYSEEA